MAKVWFNAIQTETFKCETLLNLLAEAGVETIMKPVDRNDQNAILGMANGMDAVISGMERWDRDTLAKLDKKKLIVRYGTGIDNIDLQAATDLGIPIANCPGANANPVAEVALLHILNCLRGFSYSAMGPKNGVWPRHFMGNELDGKVVGLLGFGNIAKRLRKMLSGFDCKVMAYDSYARPDEEKYDVIAVDSMEQLFSESDIVSLHIPLNDETRRTINKKYFDLMKPTAYLVNTCRGGVIDENDLVEALRAGKLRGAGLDVMTQEPPQMDCPLFAMDNVTVTTHIAGSVVEAEERTQHMLAESIIEYLKGGVPFNIMNKQIMR